MGGASIGDMFLRKDRGGAQSIYSLGPTAGPVIAPLIGAFIVDGTQGWRWLMWTMEIASAVVVLLSACFLRETYAPVLRERIAKSEALDDVVPSANLRSRLHIALTRPFRLLLFEPICSLMALYMSL